MSIVCTLEQKVNFFNQTANPSKYLLLKHKHNGITDINNSYNSNNNINSCSTAINKAQCKCKKPTTTTTTRIIIKTVHKYVY